MTTLDKYTPVRSNPAGSTTRVTPVASSQSLQHRQVNADEGRMLPPPAKNAGGKPGKKELKQAVRSLSGYVQNIKRELYFDLNDGREGPEVTVTDENTGEIVRRMSPEEVLEAVRGLGRMREQIRKGILLNDDV